MRFAPGVREPQRDSCDGATLDIPCEHFLQENGKKVGTHGWQETSDESN
jgi:hypothetical protein